MATLVYASKANGALIVPCLVLADNQGRTDPQASISTTFKDQASLDKGEAVILTASDGANYLDEAVIVHLADLACREVPAAQGSLIKEWIGRASQLRLSDYNVLRKAFAELNSHLTLRTFIVGYSITAADLVVWATIRGNPVAVSLLKKSEGNVSRWLSFVQATTTWLSETAASFFSHFAKERAAASSAGASYDIDMPNTSGPIVTRFPPEPSGYLHIGHAKAALLNDFFAHKQPGGKLICRFDDTNPTKESLEFQDAILEDLGMIKILPEQVTYSSDYFQQMHELALKLIEDGKAFADDSELGKGNLDRKNRLPSARRDMSIEKTLSYFEEMRKGSSEGQKWCIRARIAYDSPNGTLRDPVIYRCNLIAHHRTGTQWKMYPTYDFCAPILDSIEGITLALRTNEYRDRNEQYDWIQDALGLRKVPIWDFSRMNFVKTVLSKRKLTKIVNEGKVWGWDDPRMPTIRGVLRRGLVVPALREFVLKQGPSRNVLNLEWGALWAMNKKYIDNESPRYTAITIQDAVRCHVRGVNKPSVDERPKHAKNPGLGRKRVMYGETIVLEQADARSFVEDEEITLMGWGNAFVRNIVKSADGETVASLEFDLHLEGDFKKTKKKITWLYVDKSNSVPVDLLSFDYLLSKDKLDKDDELEKCLNQVTEFRNQAIADCNIAELLPGAIIQFERKGYYRLDSRADEADSRMVFFEIPTGRK